MVASATTLFAATVAFAAGIAATVAFNAPNTESPEPSVTSNGRGAGPQPSASPIGPVGSSSELRGPSATLAARERPAVECSGTPSDGSSGCAFSKDGQGSSPEEKLRSADTTWSDPTRAPSRLASSAQRSPPLSFDVGEADEPATADRERDSQLAIRRANTALAQETGSQKFKADQTRIKDAETEQVRMGRAEVEKARISQVKAERPRAEQAKEDPIRVKKASASLASIEPRPAVRERSERVRTVGSSEAADESRASVGGRKFLQTARPSVYPERVAPRKTTLVSLATRPKEGGRPSLAVDKPARTIAARQTDESLSETRRSNARLQSLASRPGQRPVVVATRDQLPSNGNDDGGQPTSSSDAEERLPKDPGDVIKWLMEPGGRL